MLQLLYTGSKWALVGSLLLLSTALFYRDRLPDPDAYQHARLSDPIQRPTHRQPFTVNVADQRYRVKPVFDYQLEGVIVSYHDADDFSDIWHHEKWQDFLNVRDLCVIWGANVSSGVYQAMEFDNDSWTCWASWPDAETGNRFTMRQLSNNHLLVNDDRIKRELMSAQPGNHIRLSGQLVSYENPANGFLRGTSTRRDDTGNGACETVFVESFEIVNQASTIWRRLYAIARWTLGFSLALFLILFFIVPARSPLRD
jgi:hypothetical protein